MIEKNKVQGSKAVIRIKSRGILLPEPLMRRPTAIGQLPFIPPAAILSSPQAGNLVFSMFRLRCGFFSFLDHRCMCPELNLKFRTDMDNTDNTLALDIGSRKYPGGLELYNSTQKKTGDLTRPFILAMDTPRLA